MFQSPIGAKNPNDELKDERIQKLRDKHKRIWSKGFNRGFSEEELQKFFSVINNPKHLL